MKYFAKRFTSLVIAFVMLIVPFSANFIYAEGEIEQQTGQSMEQAPLSQSQAAADASASLEFPNYTFEEEKHERGPDGFISGVLSDNTRSTNIVTLDYSVISLTEGGSFQLTVTAPAGAYIVWGTSDRTIANVATGGNGLVTAVKAGTVTIYASYLDSNYNEYTATCTVHVVIANEGVCRIQNKNSGLYLNVRNGRIQNNTQVEQEISKSASVENEYIRQLWRIEYMQDGYYNIRPYINYGMALYANGNNVSIYSSGYTDDIFDMASFRWTIEWDGVGYVFKYIGSSSYTMQTYNSATTSGAATKATNYSPVNNCRWTVTSVSNSPRGLMLYNTSGSPLNSTQTKYIAPEEVMSLNALDFKVVLYAGGTPSVIQTYQNLIRWTSGSSAVATVDSVTGAVMGVAEGQTTITARITLNTTLCSCSYTAKVTNMPEGSYFIQNRREEKYVDIQYEVMSNGTLINIWQETKDASQRWVFTLLPDGYYTIKSANGSINYYLGVENNSTSNNASIVLRTGAIGDGMKWRFEETSNGAYKIIPKTGEANSRVLSLGDAVVTYEYLQQINYTDDSFYTDEWYLVEPKDKAIVIVPGMLGSELQKDDGISVWIEKSVTMWNNVEYMELDENGDEEYSINSVNKDNFGADNTYNVLYTELHDSYSESFDVIFFDYDFRLSNSIAASELQREVSCYDEIVIVAHSMGGLVSAKYLANSAINRGKTSAFISLGTPYAGSAKCANVMEGGDMLSGIGSLLNSTITDLSINSPGAYELLPTVNYEDITYEYPVSVNGQLYSNAMQTLQNASWARQTSGNIKPMFDTAMSFHASLFNSEGTHVTRFTDVPIYTIAGGNEDTIATVVYDSNYNVVDLEIAHSGDGTVLWLSAGYGAPYLTYSGVDHMELVTNEIIIDKVKEIITQNTGVSSTNSRVATNLLSNASDVFELDMTTVTTNEKGWILGFDNQRIKITTENTGYILVNGVKAVENGNKVYDATGKRIGSIWTLGDTGKKLYFLYDGEYSVEGSNSVIVKYMNNGYYEKIVEYSSNSEIVVSVESCLTKATNCAVDGVFSATSNTYQMKLYTEYELKEVNN